MRVLLLNYEYPPLGGGAGNATRYIVDELAALREVSIDVVASSPAEFQTQPIGENATLHLLDVGKRGDNLHYQTTGELLRFSRKALAYCRKLKEQKHYELCHAFFGIPCGYIARRLRLPYIVSLRGSDVPYYSARFALADRLIFSRLSCRIWADAGAVVANSEDLKNLAGRTAPEQNIQIIPNGVDTERFHPGAGAEVNESVQHGASAGNDSAPTFRALTVGRLIPRKRIDLMLRALTQVRAVTLTVVGSGPEERALRELARELDVAVDFLGARPAEELPALYRRHDLYISAAEHEGMSNSLLEALASGLPIITTDTGGARSLIAGNGEIVSRATPADLGRAVESICTTDPATRAAMSRRSREIALQYSWSEVAQQYLKLYRQVRDYQASCARFPRRLKPRP